ncbi:hypothetical protein [Poriferisphaera corsica]|uniref:hypothetical protein n=1 Tax=Poriferisphaera corsica TaxID=2528020 RepID=UPI0011A1ADE4|nr:hypothetical protein [Poriferisphaera corsica]
MENKRQLSIWDRLMFIAATATALLQLESRMKAKDFQGFFKVLCEQLRKVDPKGDEMLTHLVMFIHQRAEYGVPFETSIGSWVISNIKGAAPTEAELIVAPQIGEYLADSLNSWWTRI